MRPQPADKLLPWINRFLWLFWFGVVALNLWGLRDRGPRLAGLGWMIYSTGLSAKGWIKSRAEFESLPPLSLPRFVLQIPSRTIIKVKDLESTSSWYTEKLGLRTLRQQSGHGGLALKFSENDHPLILVTDETVTPFFAPHFAVLFSRNLARTREALVSRGIEAGTIEVDLGGTRYFDFHDPESNEIEVCAQH